MNIEFICFSALVITAVLLLVIHVYRLPGRVTMNDTRERRRRILTTAPGGSIAYTNRVLSTAPANLIGYWPLNEISGTNADDKSSTGADGTYSGGYTLGQTGIGDGNTSVLFDGTTDRVDLDVSTLDGPFDGALGSMMAWIKVRAASVLTDGIARAAVEFGADANNRVFINKNTTNNQLNLSYRAGGTAENLTPAYTATGWQCVVITWNKTADNVTFYINGVSVGSSNTLGVWSGALTDNFTAIGNFSAAGGANFWDGYLAHVALWNTALTASEVALLAPAAFLV